jgi:hypothetical protein
VIVADFGCNVNSDVTGEEAEDVESELKGIKLYVNRGSKGFSDGMIGHLKLLSNKKTQTERLRELTVGYIP